MQFKPQKIMCRTIARQKTKNFLVWGPESFLNYYYKTPSIGQKGIGSRQNQDYDGVTGVNLLLLL